MEKIDILINTLLDKTARDDERDDAAMDLGRVNHDRSLSALLQIASDPNEDEMVLDSCGESIAQILVMRGRYDQKIIEKLAPIAKNAAYAFIKETKPELLNG